MENSRLRQAAPTSVNVTVGKSAVNISPTGRSSASSRPPSRTALGIGTPRLSWSLTATVSGPRSWWHCAGTTSTSPRGACMYVGPRAGMPACIRYRRGKAARCASSCAKPQVPIRLHLGASRAVVRSRISAHGCQGGRGCEIHVPRAFPHAAACLRVQARQRRQRHSRHPSLSRPPIDHVHGPLHGLDSEPIQKLLERLTFQASSGRSGDHLSGARPSECACSCRHHLLVCRVTRQCNHATITDRRF